MSIFKTSDFKNPIHFIESSAKKISDFNKIAQIQKMLSSPEARQELIREGTKLALKSIATKGVNWIKDKDIVMKYLKN